MTLSNENEIMSYSLFCQPLNPIKGFVVKKYDNKYFTELKNRIFPV